MTNSTLPTTESTSSAVYKGSFENIYMVMDNLDEKSEPIVHAQKEQYNADFFYHFAVVRGTLSLVIDGTLVELHASEAIGITPCTNIAVKESRCIFFSMQTPAYIMNDIAEHCDLGKDFPVRAYSFTHVHYGPEQMNIFLAEYKRQKREHQRPDYPMKEMVLRAYTTSMLARILSFATGSSIIDHAPTSKQDAIYRNFINILSQEYKKERSVSYYAQRLNISSKYLSTITQAKTGASASQVIDLYVVHLIKQTLYTHEYNIKELSKMFHFPSQSFFGRFFKRVTGLSPNEYIKQNNKTSLSFKNDTLLSALCQQ